MKYLLLLPLLLLGSCSQSKKGDVSLSETRNNALASPALQNAISDYIRKETNDPSSYEPVEFGKPVVLHRCDSMRLAGMRLLKSNIRAQRDIGDSLITRADRDTVTVIGQMIAHSFRAKNQFGALVLSAGNFVVYKTGAVGTINTDIPAL